MADQSFMKEKAVLPLVLKMSLPMVISMLVNALYNIVDSFFVAQIGEDAMTALSLIYPLQNLSGAVGIGFGVGINAVVAFFLGAKKQQHADNAVTSGLILSILHGVLLCMVCALSARAFISLFTESQSVIDYGLDYFYIVVAFAPVVTLSMAFEKIFQAVGRMKTTMVCLLVGCILNIILDPLLISGFMFIPAMGVKGAAIATGIGQTSSLIIYIILFFAKPIGVRLKYARVEGGRKIFGRMYAVGVSATLNLALPSFMIMALNAILAAYSQAYVLILGAYYKLQTFIYFTANGIVQGIRPVVGYNYGAGRADRVRSVFLVSLIMSAAIMAVGTILCLAVPQWLIGLFTDNPDTITHGAEALRIICGGFIVSAASVAVSGVLEGLGKGVPSLIISVVRYIAIIGVAYLLTLAFKAQGVWHAFWITEIIAAALSVALYFICIRRGRKHELNDCEELG